ncbi:MAG: hypothetical protein ACYCVB_15895 [Bacilli bacterium]
MLNRDLKKGELTRIVSDLCKRVEFTIKVREYEDVTDITPEDPLMFVKIVDDLDTINHTFMIKSFPLVDTFTKGEMYVFANNKGGEEEEWDRLVYASGKYLEMHPTAEIPELPSSLSCLHGVSVSDDKSRHRTSPFSFRLDHRGPTHTPNLARDHFRGAYITTGGLRGEILAQVEYYLSEHLARSAKSKRANGWIYRQRLAGYLDLPMWNSRDDMIHVWRDGQEQLIGIDTISNASSFIVIKRLSNGLVRDDIQTDSEVCKLLSESHNGLFCVLEGTLGRLCDKQRRSVFDNRTLHGLGKQISGHAAFEWANGDYFGSVYGDLMCMVDIDDHDVVGHDAHTTTASYVHCVVFNRNNVLVQWMDRFVHACRENQFGLTTRHSELLLSLFISTTKYHGYELDKLQNHLNAWNQTEGLPLELRAPIFELHRRQFWPSNNS